MRNLTRVSLAALLLAAGCDSGGSPARPSVAAGPASAASDAALPQDVPTTPETPDLPATPDPTTYALSQGNSVLWKRHAALEADLMRALELKSNELCKELGERDCIRDIHVIALGGNDPFRAGINQPPSRPLSTTSIVVDRVLLSACSARARADKTGPARVFSALDLKGPAPAPDAPGVETTISDLFRRLLARDPKPRETALIKSLLDPSQPDGPQSAEEFATLACFTVGSSLEFLFQ